MSTKAQYFSSKNDVVSFMPHHGDHFSPSFMTLVLGVAMVTFAMHVSDGQSRWTSHEISNRPSLNVPILDVTMGNQKKENHDQRLYSPTTYNTRSHLSIPRRRSHPCSLSPH